MASTITNLINTINVAFPVAGQDNDSEGFRTNFNIIQQSLLATDSEVEALQTAFGSLGGTAYVTATHIVALQDLTIAGDVITVDTSTRQLVVTSNGRSGTIVLRPNTVTAYGVNGPTDSVTTTSSSVFLVDNPRNIQVGATLTFPNVSGLRTVTNIDGVRITVTPPFSDIPAPFADGQALQFVNPFFNTNQDTAGDLIVNGSIYATGNITGFWSSSDETLKENIHHIRGALSKVKAIDGVMYDWKDSVLASLPADSGVTKHDTGVIAQQVQTQLPEVVFTKPDGTLAVRYEKMVGLLVEAIKELSAEVDELKKQLNK